jgi:pyrophosphatase PpaX
MKSKSCANHFVQTDAMDGCETWEGVLNRSTLIMLDLDGTVIDTSQLYFQGVPMVVQRHLGISISGRDLLPMWGQLAIHYFRHFAVMTGRSDPALIDTMYAEFSDYYNIQHNRLTTVYDGVYEALGPIRQAIHALGVVTTRPRSRSVPVLEMPWAQYMDFFVWGDQVKRNKPFPDGLEAAMAAHAKPEGTCVYVGDNPHDIVAAQRCHRRVISVGALWGTLNRQELLAAHPDRAFETFADFAKWVIAGDTSKLR